MNTKKKHTDPRILRTRQLLKDAFIDLLQEMDIEKITVNSLAEQATINRVTFYSHYRDIPDMIEKLADDMIADISSVLSQTSETGDANWSRMVNFLQYLAENASFYKIVLTSKRISLFRDRLLLLLTDTIVSSIEKKGSGSTVLKAGIQKDILIWYDSAALIGTIVAWLRNDMPYTPSYLAKQFYLLHHRNMKEGIPKNGLN
ncbi:TetR family transcriptional regulator C-terminal domain-containing protein [Radiobacillus kanasensis]|uniref:TetR/AcrR family transcriptional regulator n=1 Tax=Radiobacillus kanasensis TaxID=2844358 RepID=UPI001E3400D2|nr:TetR-like C-terminal domain-containing protein [Radiobacillus kanasensis]UFT99534.1 TetR family transcriptional regulator C-terminal domain-containing protein [Radiobacillus kanasensis]